MNAIEDNKTEKSIHKPIQYITWMITLLPRTTSYLNVFRITLLRPVMNLVLMSNTDISRKIFTTSRNGMKASATPQSLSNRSLSITLSVLRTGKIRIRFLVKHWFILTNWSASSKKPSTRRDKWFKSSWIRKQSKLQERQLKLRRESSKKHLLLKRMRNLRIRLRKATQPPRKPMTKTKLTLLMRNLFRMMMETTSWTATLRSKLKVTVRPCSNLCHQSAHAVLLLVQSFLVSLLPLMMKKRSKCGNQCSLTSTRVVSSASICSVTRARSFITIWVRPNLTILASWTDLISCRLESMSLLITLTDSLKSSQNWETMSRPVKSLVIELRSCQRVFGILSKEERKKLWMRDRDSWKVAGSSAKWWTWLFKSVDCLSVNIRDSQLSPRFSPQRRSWMKLIFNHWLRDSMSVVHQLLRLERVVHYLTSFVFLLFRELKAWQMTCIWVNLTLNTKSQSKWKSRISTLN